MSTPDADLPLFSVSEFTTWHQTFEQDVALYLRLGIKGIEVCERKLSTDPNIAQDQLKALRNTGLRVTSVQPRVHALYKDGMCPELDDPIERTKRYRQTIDLFASAFPGENLPLVTISGGAPDYDFRAAHATARTQYRLLADYAADHGVRIMFEPLSPVLMNVDTFICNLSEAMQLIQDVDRPKSFGLMLDVWHVWREPNICERIRDIGRLIFGVHICDWPKQEPRHFGDRVLPGDGVMDLPGLFGAIDASGYRDAYCLEIFSLDQFMDSLWKQDPTVVIERGRSGFLAAWRSRIR
jgi:sugar phosphate isomerase/epimerase